MKEPKLDVKSLIKQIKKYINGKQSMEDLQKHICTLKEQSGLIPFYEPDKEGERREWRGVDGFENRDEVVTELCKEFKGTKEERLVAALLLLMNGTWEYCTYYVGGGFWDYVFKSEEGKKVKGI